MAAPPGGGERPVLGARFIIRLPALPADWAPGEAAHEHDITIHATAVAIEAMAS